MCLDGETWDFGEAWEPGGCSVGQREQENPGIGGHSSILQPPCHMPAPTVRSPCWVAPLSLSRLRRCLPRRARGRAGRLRGAQRSQNGGEEGAWRAAPSKLGLLPGPAAVDVSAAAKPRGCGGPRCSPLFPRAPAGSHSALPWNPPRWGWGRDAASTRKGGKEQPSPVGSEAGGRETFPSRP